MAPEIDPTRLRRCQCRFCPLGDHFPLMLGNGGQDMNRKPIGHGHVDLAPPCDRAGSAPADEILIAAGETIQHF